MRDPPNVAIYATSNRKNLTPDTFLEREYKFPREELEERLSLVDRFGLKIGFTQFSPKDYIEAVKLYCRKLNIPFDSEVEREALRSAKVGEKAVKAGKRGKKQQKAA